MYIFAALCFADDCIQVKDMDPSLPLTNQNQYSGM